MDFSALVTSFLVTLAMMLAVMVAAWTIQRLARNAGWIDVFWTFGTGSACVIAALWPSEPANPQRQILLACLAAFWSLRLGLYIAHRVRRSAREDIRYAALRNKWGAAFNRRVLAIVVPQAPAGALLAVSVFAAAHASEAPLGWRDIAGAALMLLAIAGEAVADEQMRAFKARAEPNAIMREGLWAWSRHPNYFFEWLGWLAYPTMALQLVEPATYLTLIAPIIMYLVLRYATGVPTVEAAMERSRGDAFRAYQRDVSVFFPTPPKRRS